jgi:hypothetical protein
MLEQPAILLRPWPPATEVGPGGAARRPIVDAPTGTALGFACWQVPPGQGWWNWLLPAVLAVHEAEDEPLLFTVCRLWGLGSTWVVRDADDRLVATVRRRRIEDRFGQTLLLLEPGPDGVCRCQGQAGREAGTLTRAADGIHVQFAATANPFTRMALLATALRW